MANEGLRELYIEELKDLYNAENQLVKALPKMAKAASSEELKQGFEEHLEQTKQQVERLDRVFEILEKRSSGKTCEGMKGLLEEAFTHVEEIEDGPVRDAALIGALQKVEHYEISAYGTVATLAEAMEQDEIHKLLVETLQEEKETDEKLTQVASGVNSAALDQEEEEEEEDEEDLEEDDDENEEEEDDEDEDLDDEDEDEDEEVEGVSKKAAPESSKKSGR